MKNRLRFVLAAALLVATAGFLTKRLLFPKSSLQAATTTVGAAQSYLIILGVGDTAATVWDGSITVTGATIQIIRGWRFTAADSITGTSSWKVNTHVAPSSVGTQPVQENGLIVKISVPTTSATFDITTQQGNFSFSTANFPFGTSKTFLGGKVLVAQTNAQFQLTSDDEEEDFPAMAQSGDDVYLAYTQFVHGDRSLATGLSITAPITDFSFLSRPAGGDQVFLMHYSVSQRLWTGPFPVTNSGEDVMRNAVAVDGQGRAWIFYSAQRNGNFDIYARTSDSNGNMSSEIRLTTNPGTDIYPSAATDSGGRVWVTWQGFRNNNLEILAAAQTGDTFSPEAIVSTSPQSDWEPAIATANDGEVAISWDTYDKGDYDVYVRRLHYTDQIGMDDPIPVAATTAFEARSSLAFDPQNRLWIAYEIAGTRWGKDFGAWDSTGLPLYSGHTVQVRVLIGNDLYSTVDDIGRVLPGTPAVHLFQTPAQGAFSSQPDPTLAQNRTANNGLGPPAGPKNTFPRLAVDSDGTVYLAFREIVGTAESTSNATGTSIGSIWNSSMVYFDGAQWHGPGVLGFTDAVSDNRPAMLALGSGRLLIAHSTDHRLSPAPGGTPAKDGCNSDIFQSDLVVTRTQQSPQLQKIGSVTPDPPDTQVAPERAASALSASYHPTINGQRLQLMRGDFHRHTEISVDGRGDGPLIDAYRYYIDTSAVNWAGCCDHDNGGAREYTWWMQQKFNDAYLLGSKFVPVFYYERSVAFPEGHRNVMFTKRGVRTLPRLPLSPVSPSQPAPDTNMLYSYLHFFTGLTAPHTSATDQGTDWRNHDPQVEPFVEIYQGDRQDYEMPGAPRANTSTDSISGYEPDGYVSTAMSKGYQFGFEASSDHISTHISFTNVWVTNPTRQGLADALSARHVYGSTDDILADFRSGTHMMGDAFNATTPPVFTVRLWGTAPFQSVVVVKNGNVVYSTSGDRVIAFTWQDTSATKGQTNYYYVRGVEQPQTGQPGGQVVWVSPMWVTMQ